MEWINLACCTVLLGFSVYSMCIVWGGCGSSVFRLRMEFEGLSFVSCEKPGDGSFFRRGKA